MLLILSLLLLAFCDPLVADEPAASETPESGWVEGKITAVEQFEDRFGLVVDFGSNRGIEAGLPVFVADLETAQAVAIGDERRVMTGEISRVVAGQAWCRVEANRGLKSAPPPQVGDVVQVNMPPRRLTFIIAKHGVIHDRKFMAWEDVPTMLREHKGEQNLRPESYFTRGTLDSFSEKQDEIARWWGMALTSEFSIGSVNATGLDYDAIESGDDLLPDESLRREGVITIRGQPVAGAEVCVFPAPADATAYVYLQNGRFRDKQDLPGLTNSTAEGRFTIYPARDVPWYLVVLHRRGIAVLTREEFDRSSVVELHPWARMTVTFDVLPAFQESPNFSRSIRVDGYGQLSFNVYETPGHADDSFYQPFLPPGAVTVSRSIPASRGGSLSMPVETIDLQPGEHRECVLGPLEGNQLQQALEYLQREGARQE